MDKTPILGLVFTGDVVMDTNLSKIDFAFGKLGLEPVAPLSEPKPGDQHEPPTDEPPTT